MTFMVLLCAISSAKRILFVVVGSVLYILHIFGRHMHQCFHVEVCPKIYSVHEDLVTRKPCTINTEHKRNMV